MTNAQSRTARDIMTADPECIGENESLLDAARKMRDLEVGALPICGEDGMLKGMITDRDIVVKCIAEGDQPATVTAGSLATGKPVTIGADDSIEEALATMAANQVRRLPVIDGHRLVGMISEKDVAHNAPADDVGAAVDQITQT